MRAVDLKPLKTGFQAAPRRLHETVANLADAFHHEFHRHLVRSRKR